MFFDFFGKNFNKIVIGNLESIFGDWEKVRLNRREWRFRDNKIKEINDLKKSFKLIFIFILLYL